jgi:hypothetical protein
MDWVRVYDLADDRAYIDDVQRASLDAGEFGLEIEPALFGSTEWWSAVESGQLPTHWVEGVIRTPLWGSMNDYPEVVIEEDDGGESSWTRFGDVTQYSKGRRIRLSWVMQRAKTDMTRLGLERRIVLGVWVEGGRWRPTAAHGAGPGRSLDDGWEGGPAAPAD